MTTNPLLSFFKESVEGDTDFGVSFKEMIYNRLGDLAEEALNERKKHVAAIYFSEKIDDQEEDLQVLKQGDVSDEDKKKKVSEENVLDETARSQRRKRNTQRMGRLKVVKVRVRQGKVQRRRKVSAVKGYTIRKGKLTRMKPSERRKRKMGARKAKFKRKAKLSRIRTKLKRSLRRRKSLGL